MLRLLAPFLFILFGWLNSALFVSAVGAELPTVELPKYRLQAQELAVIVNARDPLSREIAAYYQKRRDIPAANIIEVDLDPQRIQISVANFDSIRRQIEAQTPPQVQAYALTWAQPYKVGCMSITAALTFGFDKRWCSAKTCATTAISPYYNSYSAAPSTDHKVRPTMSIAATDLQQARALIDRGIASDGSRPAGTVYLVSTADKARNVRARFFQQIQTVFAPLLEVRIEHTDALRDRDDVLFYFTGRTHVDHLESLTFLPGAVADHLTSAGGKLTGSKQMSALRWLEAGATGSYGTVVEPCAHTSKFPHPGVLLQHYLRGATLIEAYWKSVQMPGEGIFIGEPLAAPFDDQVLTRLPGPPARLQLQTGSLAPGLYRVEAAPTPIGPFRALPEPLRVGFPPHDLQWPDNGAAHYRLRRLTAPRSQP